MYDIVSGKLTSIVRDTASQPSPSISGNKIVWHDVRNGFTNIYMYVFEKTTIATATLTTVCGDGTCSSGETSTNCVIDCTSNQQQTTSTGEMTTINPTYQNETMVSLTTQQIDSAMAQEGATLSIISQEPAVPESVCAGCFIDKKCLSIGVRTLTDGHAVYCDSNRKLNIMKEGGIICINNYECVSNSCRKGVCLTVEELKSKGAIQDVLDFLAGIFS